MAADTQVEIEGKRLKLSNLDKILYPEAGYTKGQIIDYYTRVANSVIAGTWKAQPVWGGMKDGFIALAPLNASVPADVAALVESRRVAIASGVFRPFSGKLVDNEGRVRLADGALDDHAIATMNWFVQGVAGSLPKP